MWFVLGSYLLTFDLDRRRVPACLHDAAEEDGRMRDVYIFKGRRVLLEDVSVECLCECNLARLMAVQVRGAAKLHSKFTLMHPRTHVFTHSPW